MIKKHPKANLENYSKLFAQLGLVLSLFIAYLLIQNKTSDTQIAMLSNQDRQLIDVSEQLIDIKIEVPKIKQQPPKKVIIDVIDQIKDDDDVLETLIDVPDVDAPVDISKMVDLKLDEEFDPKDEVDYVMLEEAPLFPGCKGTKEELKACFSKQISNYINRKFNAGLAEELGLTPGVQRIFTLFKIDKNGNVVDIQSRAPHKRLQEEAIRVIKLLPKMEPGKQQGTPVKVRYSMPIVFKIE
ncbi:energy transducer TonB [Lutibacter sp. A80]|uniref:energy transducer TonB n=1 Tax=Lutibacter sp. A80 TaxID=2918453 RepID=UPI001F054748|nr:energy transducer TonB [Lutibacter sp. A80]UMB59273.1 energy transducer TonB [Lutibacter sp. A80]